ncbi:MAG: hypothetical protein Q7R95_03210 [bacterium]|nr:hypothetical protein [bacterium]
MKPSFLFNLQKSIALCLLNKLENKEISLKRTSEIASNILILLKSDLTNDRFTLLIPYLKIQFPELLTVFNLFSLAKQEENNKQLILDIKSQITKTKIDNIQNILKSYIK